MRQYEELSNAIIIRAVKDYRILRNRSGKFRDNENYTQALEELENFFYSEWFSVLTDMDGTYILKRVCAIADSEV